MVELEPAVEQAVAVQQVLADKPAVQVALHKQVADKLAVQAVEPVAQELVRMLVVCRMSAEVGKTLQP